MTNIPDTAPHNLVRDAIADYTLDNPLVTQTEILARVTKRTGATAEFVISVLEMLVEEKRLAETVDGRYRWFNAEETIYLMDRDKS